MQLDLRIKRDLNLRCFYKNLELKQKVVKALLSNSQLPSVFRRKMMFNLDLLQSQKKSISFFIRFCLISGRNRGVYRFFRLARACIKRLFVAGCLPGIEKSS